MIAEEISSSKRVKGFRRQRVVRAGKTTMRKPKHATADFEHRILLFSREAGVKINQERADFLLVLSHRRDVIKR